MRACNLCGSTRSRVRFAGTSAADREADSWRAFRCTHGGYGVHGPILQCGDCGLLYAGQRPATAEIEDRYLAVEDPLYDQERAGRELTFRRHVRALERLTGPADGRKLLDVGAYTGVFVEAASRAGWEACGLEPSTWAVEVARSHGLPVEQGFLRPGVFPPGSFDVITLWDVIEHLTDPRGALRICHELLRPGGWIAVHTMDAGSLTARLLGRRWPWLMEMHLFYFDRKTLPAVLAAAGFETVRMHGQARYLRLGYLATRLQALAPPAGRLAASLLRATQLDRVAVPVTSGDLFTCYACR